MAIGLSASLNEGPGSWKPFVEHAFGSNGTGRIPGLANAQGLDRYQSLFAYLVNNLDRVISSEQEQAERTNRFNELTGFAREFVPEMMLARTRTSIFRGKSLGEAYGRIRLKRIDMKPGETRDIFRDLANRINSYINQQYDDAFREWDENGREGEMPNRASMRKQRVQGLISDNDNKHKSEEFSIVSRASCFPYIATLHSRQLILPANLLVDDFRPIATTISQLLGPVPLNMEGVNDLVEAVDAELAESTFFQHRDELWDESPKIQWVAGYLRDLIRISKLSPDSGDIDEDYGPPPIDGTNFRHALLFSHAPISAFLTFMILWHQFREYFRRGEIVLLYAHAGISTSDRARYTRYMQESCENDRRCKVLISTNEIFGEGHNLQRVNTVILTEITSTYAQQRQSFGRVDRQGQRMTALLYQLYDEENLAERVKRDRNQSRRRLISAQQGADGQEQIQDNQNLETALNYNSPT
ncbi:P-loop containing nucleoside triphosphate hydrolase protein [Xylaria telfairii]|nr:P-loop containing nucleoside triphosphate hydrolase protein [Xylaria telfairii]